MIDGDEDYTNAQIFARAGELMYGDRWQQPLAALLGWPTDGRGQNRTVQRIARAVERGEEYPISDATMDDLRGLLQGHALAAHGLATVIREKLNKPEL